MNFDLESLIESRVERANTSLKALKVLQGRDKEVTDILAELAENFNKLGYDIDELKGLLDELKKKNVALQDKKTEVGQLLERIEYLENNLPASFLAQQKSAAKQNGIRNGCAGDVGQVVDKRNGASAAKSRPTQAAASSSNVQPKSCDFCQLVTNLTQDEFDNMPNYLKGRGLLTYSSFSKFVEYINDALYKKYKIVFSPRTVREKQAARQYKEQETKDTKGVYFVTEEDLKETLNLHYSHNAQVSIWGILRSFQRTREIRGQKLLRFAVIPQGGNA